MAERKIYEFEEFRLDALHLMLYRNTREILLPPKAVETLLALVERGGEILHKDELMEIIWSDRLSKNRISRNICTFCEKLSAKRATANHLSKLSDGAAIVLPPTLNAANRKQ